MRIHIFKLIILTAILFSSLFVSTQAFATPHDPTWETEKRDDLHQHFTSHETAGTMYIHTLGSHKAIAVNTERSKKRILPSSTFKIPNSLIAFEEGVVRSPNQAFKGPRPPYLVDGKPLLPTICNGDITFIDAFRNSCIPIYQEVARKLSRQTYTQYMKSFDYGNRKISSAQLDNFWLEGKFAISAREQVEFLAKLYTNKLPLSPHSTNYVKEMMLAESNSDYRLYLKTGYVFTTYPRQGWWVGWIESKGLTTIFALNMNIEQDGSNLADRTIIGKAILKDLGIF